MPNIESDLTRRVDDLSERYGKPLESKHWAKLVPIAEDGKTMLGDDLLVTQRARDVLGPGNFIFKVGERAVGKWR
jgi:hypothetical protein